MNGELMPALAIYLLIFNLIGYAGILYELKKLRRFPQFRFTGEGEETERYPVKVSEEDARFRRRP